MYSSTNESFFDDSNLENSESKSAPTKDEMAAALFGTNCYLPTSLVAAKLVKYQDK